MSETKFTKGNWYIDDSYVTFLSIQSEKGNIAEVDCDFSRGRIDPTNEHTANAHLIAAAPELYAMLEAALSEMHSLINEVNGRIMSNINSLTETPPDLHDGQTLHEIQLLLAKARGES